MPPHYAHLPLQSWTLQCSRSRSNKSIESSNKLKLFSQLGRHNENVRSLPRLLHRKIFSPTNLASRVQSKDSLKQNALTDQAQEESRARVPILEKRLVELKTQLDALQNKPAPLPQSDSIPRSPKTSDIATNDASNSVATPATAEAAPLPSQNLAATGDAPLQPPATPAALKVTLPESTPAATNDAPFSSQTLAAAANLAATSDAPPQPPAAPAALKVVLPKSTPAATDDTTTTSSLEINAEDGMNNMKL